MIDCSVGLSEEQVRVARQRAAQFVQHWASQLASAELQKAAQQVPAQAADDSGDAASVAVLAGAAVACCDATGCQGGGTACLASASIQQYSLEVRALYVPELFVHQWHLLSCKQQPCYSGPKCASLLCAGSELRNAAMHRNAGDLCGARYLPM